jgi:hypothetical protein
MRQKIQKRCAEVSVGDIMFALEQSVSRVVLHVGLGTVIDVLFFAMSDAK